MQDDLSKPSADEGLFKVAGFLAKSTIGLMPGGSVLAELLTLVVADPAGKRRDRFLMDLAARVEAQQLDLKELASDERVSAIVLTAVQVAQRSTGEEKLRSLREATMRGLTHVSERDRTLLALGIVDRLTDPHIVSLRLFARAEGELEDGAVYDFFLKHFEATPSHALDPRDPFFPVIWRDLIGQGLVTEKVLSGYGQGQTVYVTSPLGRFVLDTIGWSVAAA